jgi:hypothetical protein
LDEITMKQANSSFEPDVGMPCAGIFRGAAEWQSPAQ